MNFNVFLYKYTFLLFTMKRKKTVIIKNERLSQIRNNLRRIIVIAVENQVNKLTNQIRSIEINTMGKYRELDDSKKGEVSDLRLKRRRLNWKLRKSICKCLQCGRVEGDMRFNPMVNEWHCPDCWTATKLEYERTKALADSGKPTGDFAFDYYSTFAD